MSVGKGFETPTQAEMAYAPGVTESFNFSLKPATSIQYEAGVKYRLGERTRLNAAVYEIHTDDEIVVDSSSGGRTSYHNAGRTLRRGFEASLQSDLDDQWQTTLVYTRTDARYAQDFAQGVQTIDSGNRLPGVPLNNLYGELVWKPTASVSMGLEGQYRSTVYVEDSNTAKWIDNTSDLSLSATATFAITKLPPGGHGMPVLGSSIASSRLITQLPHAPLAQKSTC